MSDFGFWELALILLIALVVVGPDRLPRLLRTVGHWVGRIKSLVAQLKDELAMEADATEVKKILSDTQDTLTQAGSTIQRELENTDPLVKAIEEQIDQGRYTADKKQTDKQNDGSD